MLTDLQIRTCWAITNVFETGRPRGDYREVAVLPDGAGISYGRSQATDASGTLDTILHGYVYAGGALAGKLAPYIVRLADSPPTLQDDEVFKDLLRELGSDPVMRAVQDAVFADGYWHPAVALGERLGLAHALSYAVLYDIAIQSGIGRVGKLRRKFAEMPPRKGGDEQEWTLALNRARRAWLAAYPREIVQRTVYRPDTYSRIASLASGWSLGLPLQVRGVVITDSSL